MGFSFRNFLFFLAPHPEGQNGERQNSQYLLLHLRYSQLIYIICRHS